MRYYWLAVAGLLLGQTTGWAQPGSTTQPPQSAAPAAGAMPGQPAQPPAVPPLDPDHNPLDAFLLNWERSMSHVDSLSAQLSRTEDNKTFQVTKVYVGTAKYLKPNLAMLEMVQKNKPEDFEKFLCNGRFIYQYLPQKKEIHTHELPAPKPGQVAEDNFLSFLFGMKAEEARRRYDLKVAKSDQWYVYIDIGPRFDADKADFKRARLVLNKDTYLPRQLWFEQPSGDTVTWDIAKVESGVRLDAREFLQPAVPNGWKLVPPEDKPVVRQHGQ